MSCYPYIMTHDGTLFLQFAIIKETHIPVYCLLRIDDRKIFDQLSHGYLCVYFHVPNNKSAFVFFMIVIDNHFLNPIVP